MQRWEPGKEVRRLEIERIKGEQLRTSVSLEVASLLEGVLGSAEEEAWFIRGSDERVKERRRTMEAVASVLEGYRARLMNSSHRIQHEHDRRKRGL